MRDLDNVAGRPAFGQYAVCSDIWVYLALPYLLTSYCPGLGCRQLQTSDPQYLWPNCFKVEDYLVRKTRRLIIFCSVFIRFVCACEMRVNII